MQIICTCIYILANKETSNSPGIGIPTVTWKQNPVNRGDSQVDPECTKDPTHPPHSPFPWVFLATPCKRGGLMCGFDNIANHVWSYEANKIYLKENQPGFM